MDIHLVYIWYKNKSEFKYEEFYVEKLDFIWIQNSLKVLIQNFFTRSEFWSRSGSGYYFEI